MSVDRTHATRNPDTDAEERLIIEGASLFLRGVMAYALKLATRQPAPISEPEAEGLVAKAIAAKALGVSISTLDRHDAPFTLVGTRRRYDLTELRAWFAARGRQPAPATTKRTPDVDVDDVLAGHGLRAVGGRTR